MRTRWPMILAATAGMLLASDAHADDRTTIIRLDKVNPVRIIADRIEVHDRKGLGVFYNAQVSQGDRRTRCGVLIVRYRLTRIRQLLCQRPQPDDKPRLPPAPPLGPNRMARGN
jgi:hypothetical protein